MMDKETLQQIFSRTGGDKGSVHSYIEAYEDIFPLYRNTARKVLEIGLLNGESLLMWEEYFGREKVYGIDCSETPLDGMADLRPLIEAGHQISILDATNERQVSDTFGNIKFDVIIEDASHSVDQQVQIYNVFKKYLSPTGIYIIEDVQDIDATRSTFENLDSEKTIEILDRRNVKFRYDDVIILIK